MALCPLPESIFRCSHRVTYSDCTLGNHVYHARYLDLLEAARGEFFRHVGQTLLQWQEQDTIFPVVECRLRHRGAARYDDLLGIELWLERVERVRLTFQYRVLNPSQALLLEASTLHACTTTQDKPKRLPEKLVEALRPFILPAAKD